MHDQAKEILSRLIAIDTEYHTDSIGHIDKVYCLCASDASGRVFKRWTSDDKGVDILHDLSVFYTIKDPIYVCHAFDRAERRALKFLGVDNSAYNFICTWHLAKMLQNSFCRSTVKKTLEDSAFESESDKIDLSVKIKEVKGRSLSYAGLCAQYGLALIDTEHKEAMRKLCIEDTTEGNEQQIMDYCAEDTMFLIPLFKKLFNEYFSALRDSFCPMRPGRFNDLQPVDAVKYLTQQLTYINLFGDIADNGLPVDMERVEKVRKNAPAYREKLKVDFNLKYPGSFKIGKDNLLHEDTETLQKYLSDEISRYNIMNYPRSSTGRLVMSNDTLKDYFSTREDSFGESYRQLNKLSRKLNVVSKQVDNPFDYIVEGSLWYESLQPYGTITSRCTPSTKRFLFGWHKSLYGLLNPPEGKWLVELDYSSEETFIQCCICEDSVYNSIYNSKDIYLAFANKMKLVPDEDWINLPKDELKEKYADVRKRIKSLVLGLSYGMGAKKLSHKLGISQMKAEAFVDSVNRILKRSTIYKANLQNRVQKVSAFSLPDGFICQSANRKNDNNATTVTNWPFQSGGGMILRALVYHLNEEIKKGNVKAEILATIHDAVFFSVDEADYDSILKVSEIMQDIANRCLNVPDGWSMKVGKPSIIKHGDIWCADDDAFVKQFKELLSFSC